MKLLMMAGEVSGDYQASFLARALRARMPEIEIFGTGSTYMRNAGVDLLHETAHLSTVGFLEPVRHALPLRKVYRDVKRLIQTNRPDVAVLVDNQGFNLAVGKALHALGVPVIFYFPPQIWVGSFFFARTVTRISRLVLSAFPREAEIYRQRYGANALSYGHPLLDIVSPGDDPAEKLRAAGLDPARPVIGLMPGSRLQEVKQLAPTMVDSARIIKSRHPEMQFIMPIAADYIRPLLSEVLAASGLGEDIKVLERDRYACMSQCELVITCSGTATLELALLKVPMIAVYRLDPFSSWVARRVSMTPYVAMPNVLLEEMVVPEIKQHRMDADNFARTALDLLEQPGRLAEIRRRLGEIPRHLGESGAVERSADRIIEEARKAALT